MTEMLGTIFVTAVITFIPALLTGYIWAKRKEKELIQKAYDQAREEFDVERLELSGDLGKELSKIRQSIIQSVEAYESASRVVEDKCLKKIKGYTALEAPVEAQQQLDFFKNAIENDLAEDPSLVRASGPNKREKEHNSARGDFTDNTLKRSEGSNKNPEQVTEERPENLNSFSDTEKVSATEKDSGTENSSRDGSEGNLEKNSREVLQGWDEESGSEEQKKKADSNPASALH